jgi:hypothetical protein
LLAGASVRFTSKYGNSATVDGGTRLLKYLYIK